MSRHGDIALPWGDGEYKFRVGVKEARQIEEICDVGIKRIYNTLCHYDAAANPHGDNWRVWHIRETVRIALIGGGVTQAEALSLITKFFDSRPLAENAIIALIILKTALVGAPDEQVGKAEGAETKANSSPMKKSPSEHSTVTAQ